MQSSHYRCVKTFHSPSWLCVPVCVCASMCLEDSMHSRPAAPGDKGKVESLYPSSLSLLGKLNWAPLVHVLVAFSWSVFVFSLAMALRMCDWVTVRVLWSLMQVFTTLQEELFNCAVLLSLLKTCIHTNTLACCQLMRNL